MRRVLNCWSPPTIRDSNILTLLLSYHTDPSGTFVRYEAKAIGSGSEAAQQGLQDAYHKQMTLAEAQSLALKVLKQVMEEKLDENNVQLAQVTKEKGFEILGEQALKGVIETLA